MNQPNPIPSRTCLEPAAPLTRAERIAGAVQFSKLAPQDIRWLWPGRIPLGRITLLVSDPGLGKSLLTLDIAARVSTGRPWPDANDEARMTNDEPSAHSSFRNSAPSSVLLLTAEDDFADTVRPRLSALGADCDRIFGIASVPGDKPEDVPRTFALNRDLARLRNLLDALPDCRLIVIDPISAYLGSTNADVQPLLHYLTTIARERNIAVLIVSQLRKKDGAAVFRALGSVAFVAAARASWAICSDPVDKTKRLFLPIKNNLAPAARGLAFTIHSESDLPQIHWSPEPLTQSVDFALAAARAAGRPDEQRQHAIEWLRGRLAAGPRPANDIRQEADIHGIAYRTLYRAFHKLEGESIRRGKFPFGQWYWKLPGVDCQNPSGELWQSTDDLDEFMKSLSPISPPATPADAPST